MGAHMMRMMLEVWLGASMCANNWVKISMRASVCVCVRSPWAVCYADWSAKWTKQIKKIPKQLAKPCKIWMKFAVSLCDVNHENELNCLNASSVCVCWVFPSFCLVSHLWITICQQKEISSLSFEFIVSGLFHQRWKFVFNTASPFETFDHHFHYIHFIRRQLHCSCV